MERSPSSGSIYSTPPPSKKRKRDTKPLDELEVDVNAPEPPSKKALRRAKKGKSATSASVPKVALDSASESDGESVAVTSTRANRSEHSIWIGNLKWLVTRTELQTFIVSNGGIEENTITRIHMPGPTQATLDSWREKSKPQNRGFAYIDFTDSASKTAAEGLSETLMKGRKVLIKDAKSYEGRPAPGEERTNTTRTGNPPNERIFVGNLAFDTTRDQLKDHFMKCGDVEDVFAATFEDTGKCKGYAWVRFGELDAAEKAVRGWIEMTDNIDEESASEEKEEVGTGVERERKRSRVRKWWVNRINGRPLRVEFAEDKTMRYKKRYGKGGTANKNDAAGDMSVVDAAPPTESAVTPRTTNSSKSEPRYEKRARTENSRWNEKKADARTIAPGAALAGAERMTGAIVASKGKKITFD